MALPKEERGSNGLAHCFFPKNAGSQASRHRYASRLPEKEKFYISDYSPAHLLKIGPVKAVFPENAMAKAVFGMFGPAFLAVLTTEEAAGVR